MKASEWIDRLQAERGWGSDYRVAKELEMAASTLSRYRNKPESTMDDDTAIRVADALGERPALVLLDQAVERARSDRAREELREALEHLRGKVVAVPRVAAGGKGRIDISSVTPISAPEWNIGPRIEPEYTSYPLAILIDHERQRAMADANLARRLLASRAAAQSSYRHSLAHN